MVITQDFLSYPYQVRRELLTQFDLLNHRNPLDVRTLVVMVASSRGGSSLLFELLRRSSQMLAIDGEHVPFYKLAKCSLPFQASDSDALEAITPQQSSQLGHDLLLASTLGAEHTLDDPTEFLQAWALRLPLQWINLNISPTRLWHIVQRAYDQSLNINQPWSSNLYWVALMRELRAYAPHINPFYYDLPEAFIRSHFPNLEPDYGPPHEEFCLEEPPFIVVRPRAEFGSHELHTKPLLLKASVDAYRLPLLQHVFPKARIKVLHLTRNPAASINGLFDGWHHHGFYSHSVGHIQELSIKGYSDRYEWGKTWWNFDLPPGWQKVADASLEEVCGFQWSSAHQHILQATNSVAHADKLQIHFEDLIANQTSRKTCLEQICQFMDIDLDRELMASLASMPVVMATSRPQYHRWHQRKDIIWPVIQDSHISTVAEQLGYSIENVAAWL